jgi:hypothetical protein
MTLPVSVYSNDSRWGHTISDISVVVCSSAMTRGGNRGHTSGLTFERTISIGIDSKVCSCRLGGCGGSASFGCGLCSSLSFRRCRRLGGGLSLCGGPSLGGGRDYSGTSASSSSLGYTRSSRLSLDLSNLARPLFDLVPRLPNYYLILNC